jgi:hypothetical protein
LEKIETDGAYRRATSRASENSYAGWPKSIREAVTDYIDDLNIDRTSAYMFHKIFMSKLFTLPDDKLVPYAESILTAFKALGPTHHPEAPAPEPTADSLVTGFNEEYVDRHGLVNEYSTKLRRQMLDWIARPTSWNAPYTSMVNSSMTGKSRCHKQMANYDPVIFFCLRPADHSGYPRAALPWIQQAIENPFGIMGDYARGKLSLEERKKIEHQGVIGHLHFFRFVLKHLLNLVQSRTWRGKTKGQKRVDLWYLFAEPDAKLEGDRNISDEAKGYWNLVQKDLAKVVRSKAREKTALDDMGKTSKSLIYHLCDSELDTEQVILLIFDEARSLTLHNCDGKQPHESNAKISRFRLLRRSLRKMGKHNIRIFTLLTDTSSRLANFQPANDHDSDRANPDPTEIIHMFPTLCQMPTIDLAARDLQATCNPTVVQDVKRLMMFGRVGFSVMGQHDNDAEWMLSFATYKLTRFRWDEIDSRLYTPAEKEEEKNLDRNFIALLGPRLALQVGSFSQDARELVASHMMYLEHVGDDHHQLFTRYLSEPILSEASAQVTANHGWALPLDRLLYKIQHGVVDGGFRGEFVTKALLCIACEDAQRELRDAEANEPDSSSIQNSDFWTYSTPVTVRQFLNSLFQLPRKALKRKHDSDDGQKVRTELANEIEDRAPRPNDSFTENFLRAALESPYRDNQHMLEQKDEIRDFLDGNVFFNHWIRTKEVLRPSVLVKAWNRNAALMCKDGATGIDFVIPVMRNWSQEIQAAETRLGKSTTGKWTDEQQAAASGVISYILIQTKNRTKSSSNERLAEMVNIVPLGRNLGTHANFVQHEPQGPFLSILFDFRIRTPSGQAPVELLWTLPNRTAALNEAGLKATQLQNNAARETDPQKNVESKEKAKNAADAEKIARTRVSIAKYQIPIVSFGLDGRAFKCLETRPGVVKKLNQLLTVSVDPLDKVSGALRKELLESRCCINEEGESGDEFD